MHGPSQFQAQQAAAEALERRRNAEDFLVREGLGTLLRKEDYFIQVRKVLEAYGRTKYAGAAHAITAERYVDSILGEIAVAREERGL